MAFVDPSQLQQTVTANLNTLRSPPFTAILNYYSDATQEQNDIQTTGN